MAHNQIICANIEKLKSARLHFRAKQIQADFTVYGAFLAPNDAFAGNSVRTE
ncbi:MAG TPA: hypothetical protein VJ928_07235 [Marivita sp.]|nr:hypothetical protein [Marivita sp.]